MNFKLVSKQNIGFVLFLLLSIIVSQSRVFDFLFHTYLGRAIFIVFLFLISYLSKFLGIVSVLLVILMINYKDEQVYYEGFTDASGNEITDASGNVIRDGSGNIIRDSSDLFIRHAISKNDIKSSSTPDSSSTTTTDPSTSTTATEGFDLLGTENTLKRGKKSNSIPVNNSVRQSGNVDPYFSSSFDKENYSAF
jgi:hypothetical protein